MIRYFIPADGDDPSHPNVFQLPSGLVGSGTVRFGDVERNFPLPGRFHFRFKKKFRDAFVWVDMPDPAAPVPACDGVFTAKITRLSDGRGDVAGNAGRGVNAMPAHPAAARRDVGGGGGVGGAGGGLGGDDLLNMGHGTAPPGAIPGPGLMGGSSQPDDLLGMFDSSPSHGTPSQTASASSAGAPTAMPRSPPMHPAPMSHMAGAGVGGGGGFGVGSSGMGVNRPAAGSMGVQWQQQQHPQQQQQQFARFPPPQGRGNI
eukprot:g19895.t2